MGGYFGAVSHRDVSLDVFFGVDYHSHLGTKARGMIIFSKERGFQRQIHNVENTPFRTKFEKDLCNLPKAPAASAAFPIATRNRCSFART